MSGCSTNPVIESHHFRSQCGCAFCMLSLFMLIFLRHLRLYSWYSYHAELVMSIAGIAGSMVEKVEKIHCYSVWAGPNTYLYFIYTGPALGPPAPGGAWASTIYIYNIICWLSNGPHHCVWRRLMTAGAVGSGFGGVEWNSGNLQASFVLHNFI